VSLLDHLFIVRTHWWKVLLVAFVAGGVSYAVSVSHPKKYEADQLVSVSSQELSNATTLDTTQIDFRVSFYVALGNTRTIAATVRATQHLTALSVHQVEADIAVVPTPTSGILEVSATGPSQLDASAIAAGVSSALSNFVTAQQTAATLSQRAQLAKQVTALTSALHSATVRQNSDLRGLVQHELLTVQQAILTLHVNAVQVTPLTVPILRPGPISPHPKKAGLLGFLVALILVGEGTVVTRAVKDRFAHASNIGEITALTGLPVLAMVPRGRGPDVVEAFRTLRTNLMLLEGSSRPRTIAIVSANTGAGKSFSAVHLAESALAVDADVVLIDADLRRPVLHLRLRCNREPGLSNALSGSKVESTLHSVATIENLTLMPSGAPVVDTVGVLGGRSFRHVLDSLDSAQLVVVDTPPGAVYADALVVAAQCDATLMVFDTRSTRRRATRTFTDSLTRSGATVVGVIVNNAHVDRRDTYDGGFTARFQRR
jgi:capsular exopolysaccharide synthesis family protein